MQSQFKNHQSAILLSQLSRSARNRYCLVAKGTGMSLSGTIPAYMLIVQAASECQRSKEGQYAKSIGTQCNDGRDGRPGGARRADRAGEAVQPAIELHYR
jgi:hypothetical protein